MPSKAAARTGRRRMSSRDLGRPIMINCDRAHAPRSYLLLADRRRRTSVNHFQSLGGEFADAGVFVPGQLCERGGGYLGRRAEFPQADNTALADAPVRIF